MITVAVSAQAGFRSVATNYIFADDIRLSRRLANWSIMAETDLRCHGRTSVVTESFFKDVNGRCSVVTENLFGADDRWRGEFVFRTVPTPSRSTPKCYTATCKICLQKIQVANDMGLHSSQIGGISRHHGCVQSLDTIWSPRTPSAEVSDLCTTTSTTSLEAIAVLSDLWLRWNTGRLSKHPFWTDCSHYRATDPECADMPDLVYPWEDIIEDILQWPITMPQGVLSDDDDELTLHFPAEAAAADEKTKLKTATAT